MNLEPRFRSHFSFKLVPRPWRRLAALLRVSFNQAGKALDEIASRTGEKGASCRMAVAFLRNEGMNRLEHGLQSASGKIVAGAFPFHITQWEALDRLRQIYEVLKPRRKSSGWPWLLGPCSSLDALDFPPPIPLTALCPHGRGRRLSHTPSVASQPSPQALVHCVVTHEELQIS